MKHQALLVEVVGTFFLMAAVCFTGNALVIGFALAALVYMGGPISGGHFNPAVTLGVVVAKGIDGGKAAAYMVAQLLGAALGAATYLAVTGKQLAIQPGTDVSFGSAFAMEAIFTFLLVATVLQVAVSKRSQPNQYFGLAIGLALLVGAAAAGPISGGALNPALGLGQMFSNASVANLSTGLLYTVGPFLGALLAGGFYLITQERNATK